MEALVLDRPASQPADDQWVFRHLRYPDAFYRLPDGRGVSFRHAQYVTSDAAEVAFLLGVEKDSQSREVQCLMRPRPSVMVEAPGADPAKDHQPTAGRQRRTRRKRGS